MRMSPLTIFDIPLPSHRKKKKKKSFFFDIKKNEAMLYEAMDWRE